MSGWISCTPNGVARSSSPWVGGGGVAAQSRATRYARMARGKTPVAKATECSTRNAPSTGQHGKVNSGFLPNSNGSTKVGKVAPGERRREAGDVTDANISKSNFQESQGLSWNPRWRNIWNVLPRAHFKESILTRSLAGSRYVWLHPVVAI